MLWWLKVGCGGGSGGKKSGYGGGDEWPREREEKREKKENFCDFLWNFVKMIGVEKKLTMV